MAAPGPDLGRVDRRRRHQATRSDHNPNERGSVDAIDVDEDGVDFPTIFAAIKRHPSARYVIYERRLYHRLRGWKSEPYDGVNPHEKHFHLSIDQTREAEQDTRPWGLLEDTDMLDRATDTPIIQAALHNTMIGRSGVTVGVALDQLRAVPAAVAKLATRVDELAARPAGGAIDYDQLADAIVRRVLTGGPAS